MEYAQPVSRSAIMCWRLYGYVGLQELSLSVWIQSASQRTEVRGRFFYFDRGDKVDVAAAAFSNEMRALIQEHGGNDKRLAGDKIMLHALKALEGLGFEIIEGEAVIEKSRSEKGPDEILAIRCASVACENAVYEMERIARNDIPKGNMSENDVWTVLHAENIKRGGEWIETRLLAPGPRTNPWFQECGSRIVQKKWNSSFWNRFNGFSWHLYRY